MTEAYTVSLGEVSMSVQPTLMYLCCSYALRDIHLLKKSKL